MIASRSSTGVLVCFFLLAPLTTSACSTYGGYRASRFELTGGCADISRCFFSQIATLDQAFGGAVSFVNISDTLNISDCTFGECSIYWNGRTDYGGAVYAKANAFYFDRSCAWRCKAERGQAVYFDPGTLTSLAKLTMIGSTITECSVPGDANADYGALTNNGDAQITLRTCNFSGCCIQPASFPTTRYGAMFCSSADETRNAFYNIFYCLVEKCEGDTIIDAAYSGLLGTEGCAFIGNAGSVSLFRVRGTNARCQVSYSYFKGNGVKPLFAQTSSGALYAIITCDFDIAALPTLTYDTTTRNTLNWAGTVPHTCYLSTVYCYVSPLCPTMEFTASATLEATDQLVPTSLLKFTNQIGEGFAKSEGLRETGTCGRTVAHAATSALTGSGQLLGSEPFAARENAGASDFFTVFRNSASRSGRMMVWQALTFAFFVEA
jgi:hypothetical protein